MMLIPSFSNRARSASSPASPPNELNSRQKSIPSPTPSTSRPRLRWSRVTASRASFHGRRRGSGVTRGPSRIVDVDVAMADSAIHASQSGTGSSYWMWSDRTKPSQPPSPAATAWLALETTVAIRDGDDAAANNLRLFRLMQDKPTGPLSWFGGELEEDDFLRTMTEEQRLIYEFEVHRTYGLQ